MATTFILTRVTSDGKQPMLVATYDDKEVKVAGAPDTYYADVVALSIRKRAEGATPDEADQIMDTLVDRYSSDHRMEVAFGDGAGLARKAEVLLRKWGAVK